MNPWDEIYRTSGRRGYRSPPARGSRAVPAQRAAEAAPSDKTPASFLLQAREKEMDQYRLTTIGTYTRLMKSYGSAQNPKEKQENLVPGGMIHHGAMGYVSDAVLVCPDLYELARLCVPCAWDLWPGIGILTASPEVNASDRAQLIALYGTLGLPLTCHTCGRPLRNGFICDHQPPSCFQDPTYRKRKYIWLMLQLLKGLCIYTYRCTNLKLAGHRAICVQIPDLITPAGVRLSPQLQMLMANVGKENCKVDIYPPLVPEPLYKKPNEFVQFLYPQCRQCSMRQGALLGTLLSADEEGL